MYIAVYYFCDVSRVIELNCTAIERIQQSIDLQKLYKHS